MNTAHEQLAAIQHQGAMAFTGTDLAGSHRPVTRRVRRDRTVRAGVATLAGVGVVGAGTFGTLQLRGSDAFAPMGTASPSATSGADPSPSASAPSPRFTSVQVEEGMTVTDVVALVATTWGLSEQSAEQTLRAALPEEADGELEGWLPAGTWPTDDFSTPEQLAQGMVAVTTAALWNVGVEQERRQQVLTVASIAQAEAGPDATDADLQGVAAVVKNRLDEGTMLEIESPLRYYADVNGLDPSDDGWLIDTPYNTYIYEGLPPTPIGSPSVDAIRAAAEPADEDWLYFVYSSETGQVLFASTFSEHQENLVEVGQLEPGDVG